jgi:hypothetical protein
MAEKLQTGMFLRHTSLRMAKEYTVGMGKFSVFLTGILAMVIRQTCSVQEAKRPSLTKT